MRCYGAHRIARWFLGLVFMASVSVTLPVQATSTLDWKPYPETLFQPDLSGDALKQQWPQLTRATGDVWPKDRVLQELWRLHFQGEFAKAHRQGLVIGTPEARYIAYRSQIVYAIYMVPLPAVGREDKSERVRLLKDAYEQLGIVIDELSKKGDKAPASIQFWRAYAYGRYVQLMQTHWSKVAQKNGVEGVFRFANQVEGSEVPAVHGLLGGTYGAIYQSGYAAQLVFRSYVENCDGKVVAGKYNEATRSQFDCALRAVSKEPFPELYSSYAIALLRLDKAKNRGQAMTYLDYATGAKNPRGVSKMLWSAEDALAQADAQRLQLRIIVKQ